MTIKNNEIPMELDTIATGKKIKALMEEENITIREVSNAMNVSFQAVSKWQKGEALPTISNFYILGQILGSDVDDMLVAKE